MTTRTVSDKSILYKSAFQATRSARVDTPASKSANSMNNMPQPQTAENCQKICLKNDELWRYPDDILSNLYSKQTEWREQMKQLRFTQLEHVML